MGSCVGEISVWKGDEMDFSGGIRVKVSKCVVI